MKKQIYVVVAVVAALLLSAVSCRNKVPATSQAAPLEEDVYDNSDYLFMTTAIEVTGIGEASGRQVAKDKSFANVKRVAVDILTNIVREVAAKRHFGVKEPIEFTLPAMRDVKYDYIKGAEEVRFLCKATISMSAVTEELYLCLDAPSRYGYNQFLRDVDLVMQYSQFKSDFNNVIK